MIFLGILMQSGLPIFNHFGVQKVERLQCRSRLFKLPASLARATSLSATSMRPQYFHQIFLSGILAGKPPNFMDHFPYCSWPYFGYPPCVDTPRVLVCQKLRTSLTEETFPDEAAEVVGKEALLHISWRFLSKIPPWSTLDSKNSPTMTYKFKFLGHFRIIIYSLLASLIPKFHRYCAYKSLHTYYIYI